VVQVTEARIVGQFGVDGSEPEPRRSGTTVPPICRHFAVNPRGSGRTTANCHECVFAGGWHAGIRANPAELGFKRLGKRTVVSSIPTGGSTKAQFRSHLAIPTAIKMACFPSFAVNSIPYRHAGRRTSGLRPKRARKNRSQNRFRFADRRGNRESDALPCGLLTLVHDEMLSAARASLSGWLCTRIVNAVSACPSQAEMIATGTLCSKCMSVPQVCRASCARMCFTPAFAHAAAQDKSTGHRWLRGLLRLSSLAK
jgi:hypothetical protein